MAELQLLKGNPPATPPAGYLTVYGKTDNILYVKDDNGVETSAVSVGLVHYQVVARVVLRV
jgi:hypothetical protein